MPEYTLARQGVTPSTTNVDIALTSSATTIDRITEINFGGEATASGVNRILIRRDSTPGATPTAITPSKPNNRSAAAAATAASTFGTAPTFGAVLFSWAYNAFGGLFNWFAKDDQEKLVVVGGTAADTEISLASGSGTNAQSENVVFEEL